MDKDQKSINAGTWYTISNFLSKTLIYICTPIYTRVLTTNEYGMYSNFLSWQAILTVLIGLDLSVSINNAYIDFKEKKEFKSYVGCIVIGSIIIPTFISFLIYLNIDYFSELTGLTNKYIICLLLFLCINNVFQIFQAEQITSLKYKVFSCLTVTSSLGNLLVTLISLYFLTDKVFAMIIGNITFSIIISISLLFYYIKEKIILSFSYLKYGLSISLPLLPHLLSAVILNSTDKIMITKFCGSADNALYSIVYTVSLVLTMFSSSINKAWVPWFFNKVKENDIVTIKKASNKILGIISGGTIFLAIFSPEIIIIVGGEKYSDAVKLMPPIILSCYFQYIYTLYVNIEFYLKKTAVISIATIICAIINFIMNYTLLPIFGYIVAAYTTLISNLLLLMIHVCIVSKVKMSHMLNNKFIFICSICTLVGLLLISLTYLNVYIHYISIIIGWIFLIYNKKYILKLLTYIK